MSTLPSQGEIEQALQQILPTALHPQGASFAALLRAYLDGSVASDEFQRRMSDNPQLQPLFSALSGRHISARDAVLSFKEGAQVGDVTVEDVVGGNKTEVTFNFYGGDTSTSTPVQPARSEYRGGTYLQAAGGPALRIIELPRSSLLYLAIGLSLFALLGPLISGADGSNPLMGLLNLAPIVIAGFGLLREQRQRPERPRRDAPPRPLKPSVSNGVYGGLLGGMLSGIIIALAYLPAAPLGRVGEIFIFALLAGVVFGTLCQACVIWLRQMAQARPQLGWLFNDVTAGILGGIVAGALMGGLGGWFFGLDRTPRPSIALFAIGIIVGPSLLALFALFYDYRGVWRNMLNAGAVTLATTIFFMLVGLGLSRSAAIVEYFMGYFTAPSLPTIVAGALIFGGFAGILVGLQVGLVLTLTRLLDRAKSTEVDP